MSKNHGPIYETSCRRYGKRQLLGQIHSLGIDLANFRNSLKRLGR